MTDGGYEKKQQEEKERDFFYFFTLLHTCSDELCCQGSETNRKFLTNIISSIE